MPILLTNCKKEQKIDAYYVTNKFKEYSDKVKKVEYKIQRIDTFAQGGTVWNNKGLALIEKDKNDEIFGFSFYSKRNDVPKEYVYDKGIGFEISKSNKTYETEQGNYDFIGSPGGQMIFRNIFKLDSVYKSINLIENDKNYILKYEFENDTTYNVTNIIKTVELTKNNFFPVKVTRTSLWNGNRTFSQTILSDIKFNEDVQNSITDYKSEFKDFEILQPEKRQANKLLDKELPKISLPNLLNRNEIINLPIGKLTLIDFWEVWCGPCIASFPKVEELKNKYPNDLKVFGIVSQDIENAIKLIKRKETTFTNLVGDEKLNAKFEITSWPRYFLVDKNGIVQREYFGFSEEIEKDIKQTIPK